MPAGHRQAPRWAGRVPRWKIARLYRDDALGIHHDELIDDVYYTLRERCGSMIAVAESRRGRAPCPGCGAVVRHTGERHCELRCRRCGWQSRWDAYRRSFAGRHLIAPGLVPFLREFVEGFAAARTPREKLLRIDWLIHRFHWEGSAIRGQPAAATLIRGRAREVNAFLRELTASRRPPGIGDPARYWSEAELRQLAVWKKRAARRQAVQNS